MVGRQHFKSFYFENIREEKDVNKYACWLLSDSVSLDNMAINFGCTLARPIGSLALARGVTWWAYALNMVGLCPEHGGVTAYVVKH